jgi:hypothetical protein
LSIPRTLVHPHVLTLVVAFEDANVDIATMCRKNGSPLTHSCLKRFWTRRNESQAERFSLPERRQELPTSQFSSASNMTGKLTLNMRNKQN